MARNLTIILDGLNDSCYQGVLTNSIVTSNEYKDQIGAVVNFCSLEGFKIAQRGSNKTYKFVPVGAINKKAELFIGPESEIDISNYEYDYKNHQDEIGSRPIYIPENAEVRTDSRDHLVPAKKVASELEKIGNTKVLNMHEWFARLNSHLGNVSERVILETPSGKPIKDKYLYSSKRNMSVNQINSLLNSNTSYNDSLIVTNTRPIGLSYDSGIDEYTDLGLVGTKENLSVSELNLAIKNSILPISYYTNREEFLRLNCIKSNLESQEVKDRLIDMYNHFSDERKMQIFGKNFKQSISYEDLDLIKALEIERVSKHIDRNSTYDSYFSFVISNLNGSPYYIKNYAKYAENAEGINIEQMKRMVIANQPTGIVLIDPIMPFTSTKGNETMTVKDISVESIPFFTQYLEESINRVPVIALVSSSKPSDVELLKGPLLQPVLER